MFMDLGIFLWIKREEGREAQTNILHFVCSIFIFLFFEEISWGQRLLGFSTPEGLREVNLQRETNIHNIGSESTVVWIHIIQAFLFAILGIIIPLLNMISKRFRLFFRKISFPIVHPDLIACFGLSLCHYYEAGFHWSVPLRIVSLLAPFVIIFSGKLQWLVERFKYPLIQVSLVAVIGFLLIALNIIPEGNQYIGSYNVAWEIRELYIALSMLFFSVFEAYRARTRNQKQ
jgi:hypothetical protein